jgi:hypothetical protein
MHPHPHPVTHSSHARSVSEEWPQLSDPDETDSESDEDLLRAALPILGTLGLLGLALLAAAITAFL